MGLMQTQVLTITMGYTKREVTALLGSRSGLSTIEDSLEEIASKLAELVTPEIITA